MKLYIQVIDGVPIDHPYLEENLLDVHGEIPQGWEPFERPPKPQKQNKYQVISDLPVAYVKNADGVWTDLYEIREMTFEEKTAVDQAEVDELKRIKARAKAIAIRDLRIKLGTEQLQATQDAEEFQLLLQVIDSLGKHQFTSFDPIEPPFMRFPRQDENGKWYIPE